MTAAAPGAGEPVAVVGHVEYVDFIAVDHLPAGGEVAHGTPLRSTAAGGGGVAAAALAAFGAAVEFFCALGDDTAGRASERELSARGVRMHVAERAEGTRRAVSLLEDGGERAIVTLGERIQPRGGDPLPWERLGAARAVYFTAGDAAALAHARRASVLVATPRAREALASGPALDALVYSAGDPAEVAWAQEFASRARLVVATEGADGGSWRGESEGRWAAVPPDGPVRDTYGAGDTFAAVLAAALGQGRPIADAAALAAQWGARALTRPGAPW